MTTAARTSISLTQPQLVFLKQEADRLGVAVSEVIRRVVDDYRDRRGAPSPIIQPKDSS